MSGTGLAQPDPSAGNWALSRVIRGGHEYRDHRWQVWLWLGSDHHFDLNSRQTTELFGSDGSVRTRATDCRLQGNYQVREGVLHLEFDPIPSGDSLELGRRYFHYAEGRGYVSILEATGSQLKLGDQGDHLLFERHKKPAP